MKTLLVLLALCGTMLAAEKKVDPEAANKARRERMVLANDFRRAVDKLTPDEVASVRKLIDKHSTAKPAVKPAPAKKK